MFKVDFFDSVIIQLYAVNTEIRKINKHELLKLDRLIVISPPSFLCVCVSTDCHFTISTISQFYTHQKCEKL